MKKYFSKHKYKYTVLTLLLISYFFLLPKNLFQDPTATIIESSEGVLLGAKIADDMQWRFPERNTVPEKFSHCITQYEDAYFYKHWGFNPISIAKALKANVIAGKIKRGGSTITQQVIRLSRKNKKRSYSEKFIELLLATRIEFSYSKEEILSLYASHAPFGGNTVGLDAASWRYFGQNPEHLSWAENATLAVLPNAPSLIHINRNRPKLLTKRNKLLKKLYKNEIIDSLTFHLAKQESLPEKIFRLPQLAPHLLVRIKKNHNGERVQTSIQINLQQQLNSIISQHYKRLKQNHVYNAAAIIIEVKSNKVLAYVGNTPTDRAHQKDVDIINKPRSTGSILKPFLFTSMLNAGEILPSTIIADIPTQIAGYRPENFNLEYSGAVPANKALSKSLNIPAVRMLQTYGVERFYNDLRALQLNDISKGPNHYGLPLILGGAESNLWDLTRAYTSLSRTLLHYDSTQGKYYKNELANLSVIENTLIDYGEKSSEYQIYDAGAIFNTFKALREVNRPEGEENWEFYNDSKPIAWKTGTSYGFRDAWAIGITPEYVVGIWVGNADGEGRPGLTGVTTAAPILFSTFNILPNSSWFSTPYDELKEVITCKKSGYKASSICNELDTVWVPKVGIETNTCPYHHRIHLDQSKTFRVNSSCESPENITHQSWFVLPPTQAYYFQLKNPFYKPLPPYKFNCTSNTEKPMEFIGLFADQQIFLPKGLDEKQNSLIIKVNHRQADIKLYWYLNSKFISMTDVFHEIEIQPKKGNYTVTIVDELGNELKKSFEVL